MGNARKLRRQAERELGKKNKELHHRAALKLPIDNVLSEAEYLHLEKAIRQEEAAKCAKYFIYQVLAVACKILMEDYSKIHRRSTRLNNFAELYKRGLEALDEDQSIKHYAKVIEGWGLDIVYHDPSLEGDNNG